jgi:hypothetical protein
MLSMVITVSVDPIHVDGDVGRRCPLCNHERACAEAEHQQKNKRRQKSI